MGDKLIYEKRGDTELRFGYNSFGNLSLIEHTNSGGTTSYYYVVCNSRGVVAASNGGNVWAGIGIGAAAGALIGTGVGMAAGVALASSITATTEAVMAGGSALVAAVGSGGLGAGAMYVAENVSRALNGGGTALYSGGERALQAARNSDGKVINDSIGKVAEIIVKDMPWEQAKPVWQDFSAQFCKQASGIVNAYICNSAYQGVDSVFWSIEMPALLSNPRVTEIVIHIFE